MYTWDLDTSPTFLVVWQVSPTLTADVRTLPLLHHRQILATNIALPVALLQRCAALALHYCYPNPNCGTHPKRSTKTTNEATATTVCILFGIASSNQISL
jgi:hypothetical protein